MEEERSDEHANGEDAEGAKQADNPDPREGTDEEGGLGTQTGAASGGQPIEPERHSDG